MEKEEGKKGGGVHMRKGFFSGVRRGERQKGNGRADR